MLCLLNVTSSASGVCPTGATISPLTIFILLFFIIFTHSHYLGVDEYGVLDYNCQLISSFLLCTLEKSFKAHWKASIVALINNSKTSSPWQQIKNNLTLSLELNPFILNGSWRPCTLTNPTSIIRWRWQHLHGTSKVSLSQLRWANSIN